MLFKRKRSKGRERRKKRGRKTFMARPGPTSIHLPKNGLKTSKQVDPCRACRKEGRPLPLSLSFRCSNEKIMSFARSFHRLGHTSITCISQHVRKVTSLQNREELWASVVWETKPDPSVYSPWCTKMIGSAWSLRLGSRSVRIPTFCYILTWALPHTTPSPQPNSERGN